MSNTSIFARAMLLTAVSSLLSGPSTAQTENVAAAQRTEIVLLGTGTPYPDPNASGPATAVVVGKRVFLFDAGAGVMRPASGMAEGV